MDLAVSDLSKAIELNPESAPANNNLAWILATHPDEKYRNGSRAVKLALKASEIRPDDSGLLDTLAASYAEAGGFREAVKTQEYAVELLKKEGAGINRIEDYRKRLNSYMMNKPWRDE